MTEKELQDKIFIFLQKSNINKTEFDCIVPNINFYNWESDILFIDRKNMVYEFEIKTSIADLRADFKKKTKKHNAIKHRVGNIPNYFYMIIPIEIEEKIILPSDYGVITYSESGFETKQNPRQLHGGKIGIYDKLKLTKSIYYKYWKQRLNDDEIFNIRKNKKR